MKRSVAMMACVLSGALMIGGYSPVLAKTEAKAVSATATDKDGAEAKTDAAKADDKKEDTAKGEVLEDGVYSAEFDTDSGMFHVNEANDGKGTLTVKDGKMTLHVSLASKNIVNLFVGTAEDAQKDGAELLEPTTDTVTYSDGMTEEVYGFDIPVPAIDEEFDLALIGKKNKWLVDRGCLELSTSFGSTLNIADIIPLRTFSFCINSLKQKSTVGNIIKSSEFRDSATCVLSFCFPAVWVFNVCVFLLSFF